MVVECQDGSGEDKVDEENRKNAFEAKYVQDYVRDESCSQDATDERPRKKSPSDNTVGIRVRVPNLGD